MTTSRFPEITDELLSAYIDNAVSDAERLQVERAAQEDGAVAWRLATLRETVQLLRALPVLSAPRSFVLTPEQLGQTGGEPAVLPGIAVTMERAARAPSRAAPAAAGRWERAMEQWRRFWQGGNPAWRNALATSMVALLVLLVLPAVLATVPVQPAASVQMDRAVTRENAAMHEGTYPATAIAAQVAASAGAESDGKDVAEPVTVAKEAPAATKEIEAAAASALAPNATPQMTLQEQRAAAPAAAGAVQAAPPEAYESQTGSTARSYAPSIRQDDPLHFPSSSVAAGPGYEAPVSAAAAPAPALMAPSTDNAESLAAAAAPASAVSAPSDVGPQTTAAAVLATPEVTEAAIGAVAATSDAPPIETPVVGEAIAESTATAPPAMAVAAATPTQAVALAATMMSSTPPTAAPVTVATTPSLLARLLPWLQLGAALAAVSFGLLWWRSRQNK